MNLSSLGQYEISHRLRHGTPPPAETVNRVILDAFRAYTQQGDASGVDPFLLFTHIGDALHRRRDPHFFGAPLRWYARTLQHWAHLHRTGILSTLPLPQRTAILRHLRRADLTPFGL